MSTAQVLITAVLASLYFRSNAKNQYLACFISCSIISIPAYIYIYHSRISHTKTSYGKNWFYIYINMFSTKELPTEYCSGKVSYGWFLPKETQSAFVNELIYGYLYFSNFLLMLNIRDPSGQVSSTVRPSRQASYFSNIYFIYLILYFFVVGHSITSLSQN